MSRVWITDTDRQRELAIAAQVAAGWGCEVHPLPALAVLDWYLARGDDLLAVGELKCHTRWHKRFMLSAGKYARAIMVADGLGVRAFIFVRQPDGQIRWHAPAVTQPHHLAMMPRPDRGGQELCVFVDWSRFGVVPSGHRGQKPQAHA